ncbi:MAG: transcription termination factor Rho [Clostridia bacterium]|nr:transcription termination factor Rho [Clostridia bacterium]
MNYSKELLQEKSVVDLREIARDLNIEGVSKFKKDELIDIIVKVNNANVEEEIDDKKNKQDDELDMNGETKEGILEICQDGFGFLRGENFLTTEDDVYVSKTLIQKFKLKTGDWVKGLYRAPRENNRFCSLTYVKEVNGDGVDAVFKRKSFDDLKPIYPNEKFDLDIKGFSDCRLIDVISPIGKGQRGMIVAPPKAGKTTLLKNLANGILKNNKDIYMIVLLIDERPEEVTDIKESITGDNVHVIYSTFDERPEHHRDVAEMVLERAKRLVEHKKDVVILLDSITRLGRAYNLICPSSGKTLSGGMDPSALYMPKKFFGAARNIENGGSLTIIGTALVDTGSKMDEVIFEEFKGTGNMELVLDRRLADKRIYPAINVLSSGTRKEELLLSDDTIKVTYELRKILANSSLDSVDQIIKLVKNSKNNSEFVDALKTITKKAIL